MNEAGVMGRALTVKRLTTLHHSADHIFYFFWNHWAYSGYFEKRIRLKPVLGACVGGEGGAEGGRGRGRRGRRGVYNDIAIEFRDLIKQTLSFVFFRVFLVSKGTLCHFYYS